MDYVDFIVHVFSAEKRAFYGLERLRKSATVLSIDELNADIKAAIATTRKKSPAPKKTAAKKSAPAKKSPAKATSASVKKAVAKKSAAKKATKKTTKPK